MSSPILRQSLCETSLIAIFGHMRLHNVMRYLDTGLAGTKRHIWGRDSKDMIEAR